MKIKDIIKIVLIATITMIFVDQLSKFLINRFMPNETVILQNVLTISKTQNSEVIFGLNNKISTNIILSLLVMFIVVRFIVMQRNNLKFKTTIYLSMIIAGGISNLIDLILNKAIFDFIKLGNFPAFNIADCLVVIGWILFIIDLVKHIKDT